VVRPGSPGESGPGLEVCGLNADEFHGFAPETLSLARAAVAAYRDARGPALRITYRFDHRAGGWRTTAIGFHVPVTSFHNLPWGRD
jgi:hypothetical protein